MDSIIGLPKSKGMTIILVICNRFTMYALFAPSTHPFGSTKVAQLFFDTVVKLHGGLVK